MAQTKNKINSKNKISLSSKLKKNWQIIVIAVLFIFGMSKCTQSCNRQSIIDKQISQIEKLDSTCNSQKQTIDFLVKDTADYLNQIKMYQTFDKRRDYSDSINNANLEKQRAQTQDLINQNKKLMNKVNNRTK